MDNLFIDLEDGSKDNTFVDIIDENDEKYIVFMGIFEAQQIEDFERRFERKPKIYLRGKEVKDYKRLPCQNVYEDDDEYGQICLFPKAKYEFIL